MKGTCRLFLIILLLFICSIYSFNISAQNSHWAKSFGKTGDDRGNKIASDSKGFVYMVGVFSGSNVSFGSITLTSAGGKDIFISKYDCGGNVIWAVRMGGSGDELDECTMEVDQFDNVYVSGGFKSTATFGTVSGSTISKTSSGDADVFIAKYNENGVLKWVKTGNGAGIDNSNDMCTDNQGNIYLTGHYGLNNKSITFGSFTLSSVGSYDIFIVKIDSGGSFKWAKTEGGNGDEWGAGVGCDIFGNVYMTGEYRYSGTTTSIGGKSLSHGGLWDLFIVKYRQSDGTPVWVRTANSSGNEAMTLVKCDSFGNVFGVGNHQVATVFQSGTGTFTPTNTSVWNLMVVKYDSNGVIHWLKSGRTKNACQIHDMSMNHEQDSIIFCGFIQDSLTYGTKKTSITASSSFFYAIFDSAGNFGRAKAFGSTAGKYNYGVGVCYDPSSNIYVSGFYQGTVNFSGVSNTSNAGTIDGFLVKYCTAGNLAIDTNLAINISHPYCLDSTDILSVKFIFGDIYQWFKDGDSIQGATKNYYQPNSEGTYHLIIHRNCCSTDSTRKYALPTQITISVSLGPDTTLCGSSLALDAGNTGASYLWSNNSTGKTLNVTSSGTYWVKVTKNGCMAYDTIAANLSGLTVSLGNDTTLCKGSSISIDAANTGGAYSWNTGDTSQSITVSKAGKYVVSVSANSCSSKDSITVSYDSVVVNLGNDTTVCGASAYTLKSGISGASYLWSNSSTSQNLSATSDGTYWVKVTKNGCIGYDTASVLLSNLTAPLGNDTKLCKGYTVSLNAGNTGSSYAWNTGDSTKTITVSQAGKYKVTVSEKGCNKQDSINVAYDSVVLDLGADRNLCGVTKDTINAGNTGAVFLWKDNSNKQTLTVNSSGTYWVKVTKNGCSAFDTIAVSLNSIGVNLGNDTTLCRGQNITLNATDSCTYLWSDASTGQTMNVATAGKYWVEVSKNGCSGADTINIAFDSIGVWLGNDTTICGNKAYTLDCGVTGGSYLWSNGGSGQTLTSSSNGTYWVKVSRNNCVAADTIDLIFNTLKASLGSDTT